MIPFITAADFKRILSTAPVAAANETALAALNVTTPTAPPCEAAVEACSPRRSLHPDVISMLLRQVSRPGDAAELRRVEAVRADEMAGDNTIGRLVERNAGMLILVGLGLLLCRTLWNSIRSRCDDVRDTLPEMKLRQGGRDGTRHARFQDEPCPPAVWVTP